MHLEASDPTFLDAFLPSNAGRNDRLDRIDRLIDWPKVAALLDDVHAAPEGRPAYPPVTMVKIIVLQQWHDTADVGMEEALQDRLSFRRFAELRLMDAVPDHSTISRFRRPLHNPRISAIGSSAPPESAIQPPKSPPITASSSPARPQFRGFAGPRAANGQTTPLPMRQATLSQPVRPPQVVRQRLEQRLRLVPH